jgi:CheY-like chemotaxis protein
MEFKVARRPHLLIVDDSASARALVREFASELGYAVVGEAPDGAAGVLAAVRLRPDVVVMDWRMPDMDGVQATREILAREPATRVIAFSSADDTAVAEAFTQAGAVAYVTKPDLDALLRELRRQRTDRPD